MDAGKKAQANPYFLASRSKQEVGVNGSNATSGTYKGYAGLYNYYNIGASDGGDAVAKGLLWAKGGSSGATTYGRPWTNPYKSIVGGAQYIAKNYINAGQNTLYFQNNMPASVCQLPASAGNPNPYLSGISVYNGNTKLNLTPTFVKPSADGNLANAVYSIIVPKSVTSVTISASTISKKASVAGTGTGNLGAPGTTTTFTIVGIAQNGAQQPYTVHVTRDTK